MRQRESDIRHSNEIRQISVRPKDALNGDFVLEKSIFNNVFEKDIRKVFIYKKAERLAKALHLIAPAFASSASLKHRVEAIAVGLVDAAAVASGSAKTALSRELLALSSILSIARTSGLLSAMNAELIARETQTLLQEIASYEDPRVSLEDAPSLSDIAKSALVHGSVRGASALPVPQRRTEPKAFKGHIKDIVQDESGHIKDRREAILSVLQTKGRASIKDISTIIRGVSEKTIQRELTVLIEAGSVLKKGERRWSTYSLA